MLAYCASPPLMPLWQRICAQPTLRVPRHTICRECEETEAAVVPGPRPDDGVAAGAERRDRRRCSVALCHEKPVAWRGRLRRTPSVHAPA